MNSTGARRSKQRGFALLTVLILLLVISAVAAGIMYSTVAEQSNAGSELQKNTAYYASEAAMEKMTADLGTLYTFNKAPGIAAINGLTAPSYYPAVTNATFQEYNINVAPQTPGSDVPASTTTTISSGSNAGLVAQIIKMRLQATAQTGQVAAGNMVGSPGQQVRMTRDIEVALIPVFQFGVFSDSDLSFFPGPQFDFNPGRIFTNGNLFLSAQSGPLTFGSKVQAAGEVVRDYLANGVQPGAGGAAARSAAVNIPTAANGCTPGGGGAGPACRPLAVNEESMFQFFTRKVPNTGPPVAPVSWTTVSTTIYHGNLQNGSTGVTKLSLPFVGPGVSPFEIIRRPPSGEVTTSTTSSSRLFNQAQIRILLDDNPANLPGGQRGTDINLANYSGAVTGVATPQFMAQGIQLPNGPSPCGGGKGQPACTAQSDPAWVNPNPGTLNTPWPLISGWLRVEYRDTTGAYNDITQEWLNLGFARQSQESVGPTPFSVPNAERGVANTIHPNAILLFQYPIPAGTFTVTAPQYGWYPINMYDPREGELRDTATAGCAVAGVMNIIELDMDNLRKWLSGSIAGSGGNVETSSQNGYIVYYSDRRGMQLDPGVAPNPPAAELNGEYGFEDVINIQNANGVPNGALDAGEDVNGNGVVDTYGVATMGNGFGLPGANTNPYTGTGRIANCQTTGRANRVTGPRHAIRPLNGSLGHLPLKADGTGGTTIASENPVYVQGNYNANAAGFGTAAGGVNEAAAAVIADAVTLLSVNYSDLRSLVNPTALGNRPAATSWFRLAIAGGKNINFTAPQVLGLWTGSDDFGTDGGVHNFLRYVESWGGQTSNYEGSLVSFYYSRQAVGVFKCCTVVYGAPTRNYKFDQNFLDPAKLPPGTPRFQDIDNLGYHQDFSPQ